MRYLLAFLLGFALMVLARSGHSQEHSGHRPQDMELHNKFYKDWKMPDKPWAPCCSDRDCQPAASKFEHGHWYGKWEEHDHYTEIPDAKVEQNRETPDGRSHMCGYRDGTDFHVYCFVRGGGV